MESVFHTFFWITKLFWVIHDLLWWLKMSLSCLSDRYSIETRLWLDELKKILFRMINTACLSQDLERAFVREKNGVTAPVGACKVFLRLRCFAQHFCVSLTHTHTPVWAITFTQSRWSVAERFFMPCQHAWQPPQQHPQHHNKRLVVLQASVAAAVVLLRSWVSLLLQSNQPRFLTH